MGDVAGEQRQRSLAVSSETSAEEPRAVVDPSRSAALLAIGADGVILSRDARFAALFGVPPALAETGSSDDLVKWLTAEGDDVCAALANALRSDDLAGEISSSDGRVIEWSAAPMHREGRLFSFRAMTRFRTAVRALNDAESWLRMFATHTGGVVIELDAAARVVGTWSANSEILGMPEERFHGRTVSEALGFAQAAEFEERVRLLLGTGRPQSFELVLEVGDERRVFAVDASLLAEDAEEAPVASVLARDVTEQVRLQTKLVQAERLASVGLLAAGVAHEINNPLTYMLLNLKRVRRALNDLGIARDDSDASALLDDVEQCVDMTVEGAERVQEIVQDLRRFSRSDHEEPRTPVDVRRVLSFTLDMTDLELRRHARVVRDFGHVPLVLASEGRLTQVFLNLVLNAVQSIPEDDPDRHEIRLVTSTDALGNAVVEVRDTGVGIPAGRIGKIFDPFFTTKASGVGTGLGLAICHGITTSLGGDISVESTVGQGSVFRVVLPPARKVEPARSV
jgi:two-component system, NtrC family, sensor kinase